MTTPASGTVSSNPNPSTQGSPRNRDWSNLRAGERGSAFRGISRGKSSRGSSVRGGRGATHLPTNSSQKGGIQPDTASSPTSPSPKVPSVARKPPASTSTVTPNGASVSVVNGTAERGGRPKPSSRKQPRPVPAVVVAPASPSESSQTAPPTPSRSNRRRRAQPTKVSTSTTQPSLPSAAKTQKSRPGSTPASQTIMRKDVPPHLAAAHEAEIRHDIDALVERVRSIAMAENRPTTPGSHIDWAGDEDDSLPDLDDWGVSTTLASAPPGEARSKEISPILADTLKPLPEPNSDVHEEEEREMETYDTQSVGAEESPIQPSFFPSPTQGDAEEPPVQCAIVPTGVEESVSSSLPDERLPLHPSLPPKPIAATESLCARGSSISKTSNIPSKPNTFVVEEEAHTKTEGLHESMHAPSAEERLALERVSSMSSSERGLAASIHAPVPGLPESHSAPNLLSSHSTSAVPHTHSRSQTESRPPSGSLPHRRGRSGASSPLGRHVYTHARNHSTPAGGSGTRAPQSSRPVISGEAISKLARTIGGLGPASRTQTIPVAKDSTVSS